MQQNTIVKPDPMKVVTGEARLSYVHLNEPRANRERPDEPPKYGVTLMIPKSDAATRQRIEEAVAAALEYGVRNKWNGVRPASPLTPVWDGDGLRASGEPFGPECRGCWVVTATSVTRPGVVDAGLRPVTDSTELYSGMYGRASVRFFAYHTAGKKGIGAGLCNVQKTRDGERLGGRSTPHEDFGG